MPYSTQTRTHSHTGLRLHPLKWKIKTRYVVDEDDDGGDEGDPDDDDDDDDRERMHMLFEI